MKNQLSNNPNRLHFLTEGDWNEGWMDWDYSDIEYMTEFFLECSDALELFIKHHYGPINTLADLKVSKEELSCLVRSYATDLIEYYLHTEHYEKCKAIKNHAIHIINIL